MSPSFAELFSALFGFMGCRNVLEERQGWKEGHCRVSWALADPGAVVGSSATCRYHEGLESAGLKLPAAHGGRLWHPQPLQPMALQHLS